MDFVVIVVPPRVVIVVPPRPLLLLDLKHGLPMRFGPLDLTSFFRKQTNSDRTRQCQASAIEWRGVLLVGSRERKLAKLSLPGSYWKRGHNRAPVQQDQRPLGSNVME